MAVTVPVPITWVAGTVVTAAQLNSNLRDCTNFLLNPPRCILTRSLSVQSIPNNSTTTVAWDTVAADPYSMANLGASATNINILAAGTYRITASWLWDNNSTGARQMVMQRTGSATTPFVTSYLSAGGGFTGHIATFDSPLVNNDVLQILLFQTSGVALANLSGSYLPRFSVVMIATS
jgi:hypothetical protein